MIDEKTLDRLLLDLTAFAAVLSGDEETRRDFESVCARVEKDSPFDALVYRAQVADAPHRPRVRNAARGPRHTWPPRGHSTPAVVA